MADDFPTALADGIVNLATGDIASDGTVITVTTGFAPRHVKLVNTTDVIVWEKLAGMGATETVKTVTAGTTTIDTTTAIAFTATGFTVSAAAAGTGKALVWLAE